MRRAARDHLYYRLYLLGTGLWLVFAGLTVAQVEEPMPSIVALLAILLSLVGFALRRRGQ